MSALHPLVRLQHHAAPHGGEAYDLGEPHAAAQALNEPKLFRSEEQEKRAKQLRKLLPEWLIEDQKDQRLRFYVVRRATASSQREAIFSRKRSNPLHFTAVGPQRLVTSFSEQRLRALRRFRGTSGSRL
jgi:hypothetical protein